MSMDMNEIHAIFFEESFEGGFEGGSKKGEDL